MTRVYQTEDEWAAEMANRTVHSVMHIGWVPDGTAATAARWPCWSSPTAARAAYMAAIKPFRHLIVYPALMRRIERDWRASSASGPGAAT